MTNNELIIEGFNKLLPVLSRYVAESLKERYGEDWWMKAVIGRLYDIQKRNLPMYGEEEDQIKSMDVAVTLLLMNLHWKEIFADKVSRYSSDGLSVDAHSWVNELINLRNKSAHIGQSDFTEEDTMRGIDTMVRLCSCIDESVASEIKSLCSFRNAVTPKPTVPVSDNSVIDTSTIYEAVNKCDSEIEVPNSEKSKSVIVSVCDLSGGSGQESLIDLDSEKLVDSFSDCIVRKDLTKKIREGANVPIFVLEYLLGMYCSSNDEEEIADGLVIVEDKLARLYIRPDEAELIKSKIREAGKGYSIIDKVSVALDYKNDIYVASFLSLGLKRVPIERDMVMDNPRLLSGGIWCIITFDYSFIGDENLLNPFKITRLSPIQMPFVDVEDYLDQRKNYTKDEWIGLMLRSIGIEPNSINYRTRLLLLARVMALVENNLNICELGPRSTGKSHVYKEVSPSSILISGGQATPASLFYNMSTHTPGLVCNWDVVAFDEVAEIRFKDKDAIPILKDYMASGSFSRGGELLEGKASMVFVGNINENVYDLLLQSSLFKPFPLEMNEDTAFLDRFHCYIPGWEIEPFSPKTFTNDYGFICDYFAEIARALRKKQFASCIDEHFELDDSLKQRDVVAIRKVVSAMMKLIYPDGNADKEQIREILEFAMEMRSRVKEQLKRIQPDGEFNSARFIYHDKETGESREVLVPECVELKLRQGCE